MVPLRGNAFKRQPERLALSWSQRGDTEIHGLGIRAAGFQDLQRNVFPLDHLSYLVLGGGPDAPFGWPRIRNAPTTASTITAPTAIAIMRRLESRSSAIGVG